LHGFLEKSLGVKITVSPNSQYAGAIGCAIFAAQSKL
jgi:activator of 2-hydroxyglutaryl-CoA dehydratase